MKGSKQKSAQPKTSALLDTPASHVAADSSLGLSPEAALETPMFGVSFVFSSGGASDPISGFASGWDSSR
jgi:hypothetical protein